MTRTQIYLSDRERELLDRLSSATGASTSELIRRAIRDAHGGELTKEEKLEALDAAFGLWADRGFARASLFPLLREAGWEFVVRIDLETQQRLATLRALAAQCFAELDQGQGIELDGETAILNIHYLDGKPREFDFVRDRHIAAGDVEEYVGRRAVELVKAAQKATPW